MKLKHIFVGHKYKIVSCIFNASAWNGYSFIPTTEEEKKAFWGYTSIYLMCPCGKTKVVEITGDHTRLKNDAELVELERMRSL